MNVDAALDAALLRTGDRRPTPFERTLVAKRLGEEMVLAVINRRWERALAHGAGLRLDERTGTVTVLWPRPEGGTS
jgi:hypothetical protein